MKYKITMISLLLIFLMSAVQPLTAQEGDGSCDTIEPLPFRNDDRVVVTEPGDLLNLRAEANTGATRLAQLRAGAVVTVLFGPVCNSGFYWWQIEANNQLGWVVQGDENGDWLALHFFDEIIPRNTGARYLSEVTYDDRKDRLAIIDTGGVLVYAIDNPDVAIAFLPPTQFPDPLAVAFRPDGEVLAIGSGDGHIYLYDLETQRLSGDWIASNESISELQFAANGSQLLTGGREQRVKLWALDSYSLIWNLERDTDFIKSFDLDANESHIITGHLDGGLFYSELTPGGPITDLSELSGGESVNCVRFHPNSRDVLIVRDDGLVRLHSLDSNQDRFSVHRPEMGGRKVNDCDFSPDGRYVAVSGQNHVILWDWNTGEEIPLPDEHDTNVHFIRFTDNGTQLLTASHGERLIRYDVQQYTRQSGGRG